uniref:SEC63 domain-containing protein n=1 Tax=Plectus sambesii TaxID=2011161 RepID=A0A914UU23_9BILA
MFANIDANLKTDERGFYLTSDENLFPHFKFIWYLQLIYRIVRSIFPRTFSDKYYAMMKTNMIRETRAPVSRMLWLSFKHRLLNGAVSIRDVLKGAPMAVEMLSQHLRKNSLEQLVAHGVLTKEAVKAVRLRLDKLSMKQRAIFNLTKEDLCYWDYTGYLKCTRVYMVKERYDGEKFFLDFYVQCLMQYKKAQSCTVTEYARPGDNKVRLEIDLPGDYGYCMPRPVIVIIRLSQQLKPNKSHDLVITAFNFIVLP